MNPRQRWLRGAALALQLLPALTFAAVPAPPATWRLARAGVSVGIVCTQGSLSDSLVRSAGKGFRSPRTLVSETTPLAKLPQVEPEVLGTSFESLDPKDQAALKAAAAAKVVHFAWPSGDLAALPEAYRIVGTLAEACRGVIVDLDTVTAFAHERWKSTRLEAAAPPLIASKHFTIHMVSKEDGSLFFDTGGLERFGLADLILPRVARSEIRAAGFMLNVIIQRLVEGVTPDVKGQLVIRLADIQQPAFRKAQLESVLGNPPRAITIDLRPSPGSPDLRSEAWIVGFPTLSCDASDVCLEEALHQLFGSEDKTTSQKHDAKVLAARARARALLKPYQERLAAGFPGREYLLVKGPFPCTEGTEWMWVEVQEWKDSTLRGSLRSAPECAPGLRPGAPVEVKEEEVFDFMYKLEDGSFYGNETGKVMQPKLFKDLGGGRSRIRDDP